MSPLLTLPSLTVFSARAALCFAALCFAALCLAAAVAPAQTLPTQTAPTSDQADSPDARKFFETHIRPLLAQQCLHCHGPKRQRGELRLDSLAAMLKGGESGPAIVPGKPDESLLIEAVEHRSFQMPPEAKLPDHEIAALAAWIRQGAPWPAEDRTIAAGPRTRISLTDDDRRYWAFQPLQHSTPNVALPVAAQSSPIDAFIQAKLADAQLAPSPPADKRSLLRRLSFDLIGLPPSADAVDEFIADESPDAYQRQVDRLLAHPAHGERWARHWLDLVRYAESDGFKQDDYRPTAWRYRDYVIRSLNADKPYDRFVQEQLAGDELAPGDSEALVATGYLRHWMYEYNQRDVRSQWNNILNDITDVTSDVFLGMGIGCARCHDHKYDPLLQKDYYRLQAFFAALQPRDDLPVATPDQIADYHARLADWEAKTAELRRETAELEAAIRAKIADAAIDKFPKDVRPMMRKPLAERTPFERQLVDLADRQVLLEQKNVKMESKLKDAAKEKWLALQKRLAEYDIDRPAALPTAQAASDVGPAASPVSIPGSRNAPPVAPGFFSVLDPTDASIEPPANSSQSTGRRLTLARWITHPDNPLTARVIVNRLWQYHFGRGLVRTASDFGRLGEPPTHPELLDWLARSLITRDWQLKPLHRELVSSATYRQSALTPASEVAQRLDPDNRLWWRMDIRRLSSEQLRDSLLYATGELQLAAGGPSVDWQQPRRSVYTKVLRNVREPLLDAFDAPDYISSAPDRNVTTTPTQALLMINGAPLQQRAARLAARVQAAAAESGASAKADQVQIAYRLSLGRSPSDDERREALEFLQDASPAAWIDLCHVLLNSNEFLYVD